MPYDNRIETPAVGKLSDKHRETQILRDEIARLTAQLQAGEQQIAALEKKERFLVKHGEEISKRLAELAGLRDSLEHQEGEAKRRAVQSQIAAKEAGLAAFLEAASHE